SAKEEHPADADPAKPHPASGAELCRGAQSGSAFARRRTQSSRGAAGWDAELRPALLRLHRRADQQRNVARDARLRSLRTPAVAVAEMPARREQMPGALR